MIEPSLRTFISDVSDSLGPDAQVLIACSGGADSVALAVAAQSVAGEMGLQVTLGHVNHRLRGTASQQDELSVRQLAKALNVRCLVARAVLSRGSGNLEEKARVRRYASLVKMARSIKSTMIWTAHTRNDQAETVLMKLLRGAGAEGLSGMKPVRPLDQGILLGRPLLGVNRNEILSYLKEKRVPYRHDQSNEDETYFRNWVRRRLIPLLEKKAPGCTRRIAQAADILAADSTFWNQELETTVARIARVVPQGRLLDMRGLLSYPAGFQRRFLRRILGENVLTFDGVERLRRWMLAPPTSGRTWQLRKGWTVERLSKTKGAPSAQLFLFKRQTLSKNLKKTKKGHK